MHPSPTLTPTQADAVDRIVGWAGHSNESVFRLFGYAGTGKTTIAREIAARFDGETGFAAYTGKAASVLSSKGCPASTIHSLLYKPVPIKDPLTGKSTGEVDFVPSAQRRARNLDLLIIDECSMVGEKIGNDLLALGVPILVLGDPAQLPPVGDGGFFTNGEPDVMLTEVHRQADGSGVLDLATKIRQGLKVEGYYGDSAVLPMRDVQSIDWLSFEQIICGTNSRRVMWNKMVREKLGFRGPLPMRGERVICLRNNHGLRILNGEQFEVESVLQLDDFRVRLGLKREVNAAEFSVDASISTFHGGKAPDLGDGEAIFDFAYAITCHKSQGSQWRSVLVIDESRVFKEDAQRWLYTAVTRACDHVVILR